MYKWKDPNQTSTELAEESRTTSSKMNIRSPKDQYQNAEARVNHKQNPEAQTKTKLTVEVQTTSNKISKSEAIPNDQQQN